MNRYSALTYVLVFLAASFASIGANCIQSGSKSKGPTSGGSTPSTSSTPSSSCTTSIVDSGQKGNSAATSRGLYSDIKMIPDTNYYAVAVVDPNAGAIKLSYWNGTNYVVETIAGEGAATGVTLVFTSNGTPFVFWGSTTRLRGASRSLPLLQSGGVWAGATIDSTATVVRATDASVSPNDDIVVGYLTNTATTGRAKVAICPGTCTSAASFQTLAPNAYIENSNIIASGVQTGVGWCKASATTYYPAFAYPLASAIRYAVCQNTITNCLDSANWSASNVVATGSVAAKLYLDSTITGDIPKVMAKNASGVAPYQMGSTACTSTPVAFTAGSNLTSSTTVSTLWMGLGKSSITGKFHFVSNNSTTGVYYYNSSTTNFIGAWNAPGTVDTVTLAAAAQGGSTVDSANSTLYASYGMNAANYDVRAAKVTDIGTSSALATFSRYNPDSTGQMVLNAANQQRKALSTASTSGGTPAVAYVDNSIGATANSKLKYALRAGNTSSSSWDVQIVPGTNSPQYPGLAFDENNRPWISFFDAGTNKFYLANNSQTDGSGTWTLYEFPSTPAGAPAAFPAANNTAMAMSYSSGTASPLMLAIDNNATTRGVYAAKFNKNTQSWSAPTRISPLGASGASFVTADFISSGAIGAAFYDITTVQRARYSASSDGLTWSTPITVAAANGQGMGLRLSIDPSTGKPGVGFFDRANNAVYVSKCSGTVTTCAIGGWNQSLVDSNAGVSGLTTAQEQVLGAGFNFTSSGASEIFYARGAGNDGSLLRASSSDGTNYSSSVLLNGSIANLAGIAALNFGVAGWGADATRNAQGLNTVLYIGPGNYLYATSCGD